MFHFQKVKWNFTFIIIFGTGLKTKQLCLTWPLDGSVLLHKEYRRASSGNSVALPACFTHKITSVLYRIQAVIRKLNDITMTKTLFKNSNTKNGTTERIQLVGGAAALYLHFWGRIMEVRPKNLPLSCASTAHIDSRVVSRRFIRTEWMCGSQGAEQARTSALCPAGCPGPLRPPLRARVKVCHTNKLLFGSAEPHESFL